jgi:hypothetical protein
MRKNSPPETDHAPLDSDAAELVRQGSALMRVENESMLLVATQRPRDEAKVLKAAIAELELVPEEASKAYYSIPFRDKVPGTRQVRITKVEGPSIKAAMALARRWGNCSATARVLNEDVDGYDIEGVFIDFETNFRISRPFRVSKLLKLRGGRVVTLDPRRAVQAIQAGASKAIRNAILAGLPAYLVNGYDKKARQIVGGDLDKKAAPTTVQSAVKAFAKWAVTQEQLEQYVELKAADWTGTTIAELRGLYNAILDEQTSVEEVFGVESDEAPTTEKAIAAPPLTVERVQGADEQTPGPLGSIQVQAEPERPGADKDVFQALPADEQERSMLRGEIHDLLALHKPVVADHLVNARFGSTQAMGRADLAALSDFRNQLRQLAPAKGGRR